MHAAVLHEHGATPRFGEFDEPSAGPGQVVVDVEAAALHHLDLHKATGTFYTGPPPLPSVVGTDGVGRLEDGRRVYFDVIVPPFGSMGERALADAESLFDVPDDLDDAVAAALSNTALGGWLALSWRSDLQPGETVCVLGATGAVGSVAVQAAKLLGAGRVVAAARGDLDGVRGADAVVSLETDDLPAALRDAADGGIDVTIDTLWGEPALAAMQAASRHARHVQVGQIADASITLPAPAIRSVSLDVRGFSVAHPPVELKREAHRRLVEHARRGDIVIDVERIRLADVASAWERQRESAGGPKLVLIP
ncbi:MAG TPA: zinc-binding dehydrogenase [Solirubrobacteraceae bacterium]|nr:zinc-binding dehydrogenase [Solirubrobacteraceae bacterium]